MTQETIPGIQVPSDEDRRREAIGADDARWLDRKTEARARRRDVTFGGVVDPARRERCRLCLGRFYETYMPGAFPLKSGTSHMRQIDRLERSILEGSRYALAAPRKDGKSTRSTGAAIWSQLYGHRRFFVIICDTRANSVSRLDAIRLLVETSDALLQDFPGPCACVRALRGVWNKGNIQTVGGQRTFIKWGGTSVLAFPVIADEPSSGCCISVKSMDSALLGLFQPLPSGEILRPDFAYLDDVLDREQAGNIDFVDKVEKKIETVVKGLGGPGRSLAQVMTGTVWEVHDVMHRYLDHKAHPEWQGELYQLMESMPERMDLWREYDELRIQSLESHGDIRLATAFYLANRAEMDRGAKASWEERYMRRDLDPSLSQGNEEVSAIQHGMNECLENPDTFWTQLQNTPKDRAEDAPLVLTSYRVENATNELDRGIVPSGTITLAGGWDLGKHGIHWAVGSLRAQRIVDVLDYGVEPIDAPGGKIDPRDKRKLQALKLAVLGSMRRLRDRFQDEPFCDADGNAFDIKLTLIDRQYLAPVVLTFCGEAPGFAPAMGCGTSKNQPKYYVPKNAWRTPDANVCLVKEKDGSRIYYCHADALKEDLHTGFLLDSGTPGAVALFASEHRKEHLSYAKHIVAEAQTEISPGVYAWRPVRKHAANHYLDATYLVLGAASVLQAVLPELGMGPDVDRSTVRVRRQRGFRKPAAPRVIFKGF